VIPIVAVQIAPAAPMPALEAHLLAACNAGLEHARCVPASAVAGEKPHGVALVSWDGAAHVSIEVGLANGESPVWVSRELRFAGEDPEIERWRAVGLTIALLSDDPRFWPVPPEPASVPSANASLPVDATPSAVEVLGSGQGTFEPSGAALELGGLVGTGVVSGPLRLGAELRVAIPVSAAFFATGSVSYALASDGSIDVRWFDAKLGVGVALGSPFDGVDVRARLELLGENVAITERRAGESARASAWVPGVSLGGDLLWSLDERWMLFARADVFWLDGATGIESAGERAGASAGAGAVLGVGAGYRF
jgi:hypothetical protein